MRSILLEVCVDDAAGLEAAVEGGADRIELCSALGLGGLTPTAGLMALASKVPVPVYAMIRPRPGNFVFSESEVGMMCIEIDAVRAAGLSGVVLGANLADGRLDLNTLDRLVARAGGMGLTLHRAFDLVPDFSQALESAVALGFERILTSGGEKTAPEGTAQLAAAVEQAGGRISIMPGSGVTEATIAGLLSRLPVSEVHSSCSSAEPAQDPRLVSLGFAPPVTRKTRASLVQGLKADLLTHGRSLLRL
ncbi:copper homeostasis protein CutC [Pararhizobium antarcticum]|uniref:PF03932 family protein CutC n=1 Tax=Pararhizobium antarcticum TaxID=1798805 RepID=A0A657LRQ7_9HYPH|nr:copper homeostasis protein CutC [Pararhizobium antarcticum]OJF94961.1 copper homeostasis protein CutC [Pararhizobium antarcticum]OJF97463.1 copper homeostasis protein CutC [Rhizobium sp. 58]